MRLEVGDAAQRPQRGDRVALPLAPETPTINRCTHPPFPRRSTKSASICGRAQGRLVAPPEPMLRAPRRRTPAAGRRRARPAALLTRLVGRRVLGDGERRAIVRRIAATREDVVIAPHVRSQPLVRDRVLDALDRDAVPAPFETLAQHVRTLTAFADLLDVRSALLHAVARSPRRAARRCGSTRPWWQPTRKPSLGGGSPAKLGSPWRSRTWGAGPAAARSAAVEGVVALLRYAASQATPTRGARSSRRKAACAPTTRARCSRPPATERTCST